MKYEEVYLEAYASVAEAKAGIGSWVGFYNKERLHQALGYRTPAEVFAAAGAVDTTLRLRPKLGQGCRVAHVPPAYNRRIPT